MCLSRKGTANQANSSSESKKVRVFSMPCVELYDEQSDAYKEGVLPNAVRKRIVVEAAETFGWHRFIGLDGDSITMNRFGASAPGGTCMDNSTRGTPCLSVTVRHFKRLQ